MSLKPLGLKDNLIPPILLQPHLGQSLTPLGHLQPLGQPQESPLVQTSYLDEDMTTPGLVSDSMGVTEATTFADYGQRIAPFNQENQPIKSSPVIGDNLPNSNLSELPNSSPHQAKVREEDNLLSHSALNNLSNSRENITVLKPLGFSKPLGQKPDIPQIIQRKYSNDFLLSSIPEAETPSLSNSTLVDIELSTNVSPITATAVDSPIESEPLKLPKIDRFGDRNLGFNQQLSPFITESLEKSQANYQEIPYSSRQKPDRGESITTPSPPSSNPPVQARLETEFFPASEIAQEKATPSLEIALDSISSSLETPTAAPASANETAILHREIATNANSEIEEFTPRSAASQSPNLIQPARETTTASPTQPNIVQTRLENQTLNPLKPLGLLKPLTQSSDFLTSKFVTDGVSEMPSLSHKTPPPSSNSPGKISSYPEENLPNISRQTEPESNETLSSNVGIIPDSWSKISELIGKTSSETDNVTSLKPLGFTQPLNSTKNVILPKLEFNAPSSKEPSKTDNLPPASSNDVNVPNQRSNLAELLGESTTLENASAQKNTQKNEVTNSTLIAPETSISSPILPDATQQLTANTAGKNSSLELEEQLEMLAQKVYTLMRQWLEILRHHDNKSISSPIWLSNITSVYGTSAKVKSAPKKSTPRQRTADEPGEISPVDDKLQQLTWEVYSLIRQKLEIERERQGHYPSRLS